MLASLLHGPGALDTARAMIVATNALLPYSLSVREMGRRAEIAHGPIASRARRPWRAHALPRRSLT